LRLKILKKLRTASLNLDFTCSYKKVYHVEIAETPKELRYLFIAVLVYGCFFALTAEAGLLYRTF